MTASTAATLSGSGAYTVGIDNNGIGAGPAGSSFGAVLGSGVQTAEQTTYQFQAIDGNLASMEIVPTATPTTISATTPILASAWLQSVDGNEQPLFFGGSQTAPTAANTSVAVRANQAASNSASIACSTGATAVAVAAPSVTSGSCGTSCSAHTVSDQVSIGGGSFTRSKTMVTLI